MITKFDTNKVDEIKTDLNNLADEYTALITKFFKRMEEIPTITREWIGNQAEYYFGTVSREKINYVNYGILLKNIPTKLGNDLDQISNQINKVIKREEEAKYSDQI